MKKNKRFLIAMITIIILLLVALGITKLYAVTTNRSIITVVDDGTKEALSNTAISVTQKASVTAGKSKELTMNVTFENFQTQETSIGLVIDDSYSMWSNERITTLKTKLVDLVELLFAQIPNVEVSLSTYSGEKVAMGTKKDEIIAQINSLSQYEGIESTTGLVYAKNSLTEMARNKQIIIVTDTEDNEQSKQVIQEILEAGIQLTALVVDEENKNTEYVNSENCKVYTITNLKNNNYNTTFTTITNTIKNAIQKEIRNVTIHTTFTEEIKNNFTPELINNPSVGIVTLTQDGYTWNIPELVGDSKLSFDFKLKLKGDIEEGLSYRNFHVTNQMTIDYQDIKSQMQQLQETLTTPIICLEEAYTLEVHVINKKYQGINVAGLTFKVTQKNEAGDIIREKEYITNTEGKIILDDITQPGTSIFEIEQKGELAAYEILEKQTIIANKNSTTNTLTLVTGTTIESSHISVNDVDKVITAIMNADPKVFLIHISKTDVEDGTSLGGAVFKLTQPTGVNIPANTFVNGTTREDGSLILTAEVGGAGEFYRYQLTETTAPEGYKADEPNMYYYISFTNTGKLNKLYKSTQFYTTNQDVIRYATEVTNLISNDRINLPITNSLLNYELQLQAFNEEYKEITVPGVELEVIGRDPNTGNIVYTGTATTDNNGIAKLTINKSGTIDFTVTQKKVPAGYLKTEDVQYTFTREFKTNHLVLETPNENITVNDEQKIVKVNIYLGQMKFNVNINKIDMDEFNALENVELKITPPLNRKETTGVTNAEGKVSISTDVACAVQGGTQTYYLTETVKPLGYQQIRDRLPINITFDEQGKITAAETTSEIVEITKTSENGIEITLKNTKQEYTVQVVVANKNYKNIVIPNAKISLVATDASNNTFYSSGDVVTNEEGKVQTSNLRKAGEIHFTISQIELPTGYVKGNAQTITLNKNLEAETLNFMTTTSSEYTSTSIDQINQIATIYIYVDPQTFDLEISKKDIVLGDNLIEGANFKLTQPDIQTTKRNVLNGITKKDEILRFKAEVAGEGTYTYQLVETSVPSGYRNNSVEGNLAITFDRNGNMTKVEKQENSKEIPDNVIVDKSNDYLYSENIMDEFITIGAISSGKLPVMVQNNQKGGSFSIQVFNNNYRTISIPEVQLQVVGKDQTGREFYHKILTTDTTGKINLTGLEITGEFSFEITPVKAPTGYKLGTTKKIKLSRDKETTQITLIEADIQVGINNETKAINGILYLQPQEFTLSISKYEKELGNLRIEGATFYVKQPNITASQGRNGISGKTIRGEALGLKLEVAGEGTYSYQLTEVVPSGYKDKEMNAAILVTFDQEGNVTKVEKGTDDATLNCTDYITLGEVSNEIVPISIMNEQKEYQMQVEITNSYYPDKYVDGKLVKGVKVEGAKVQLIGKDISGAVVYTSEVLEADVNGIITFGGLTKRGDVTYELKKIEMPTGYQLGENKIIPIHKNEETTIITLRENVTNVSIDNTNKIIYVGLFQDPQTFTLEINKKDKDEQDLLIAGAGFKLTQPTFADNRERNTHQGTTKLNEKLILTAEVAGEGTYSYLLEETVPEGYTLAAPSNQIYVRVTFNKQGEVTNVTDTVADEFVWEDEIIDGNKIPLNIINIKKAYTIQVQAQNKEYESAKVEGLKLQLIGKDATGAIIYTSQTQITNTNGIAKFTDLTTTGVVNYEVIQQEERPAAFYLGETKLVPLTIHKETNSISKNNTDEDIKVNDSTKQIDVTIRLEPKKFNLDVSKLDFDNGEHIPGAVFYYTEEKWARNLQQTTTENGTVDFTGYVAGEGTYRYRVFESYVANGYQTYLAEMWLNVTFDSKGDITNTQVDTLKWYKRFFNEDNREYFVEQQVKHHEARIVGFEKEAISLEVENVQKQYDLKIRAINDKYLTNIKEVKLQVIARDQNGNEIYNGIHTTDANGEIIVGGDNFRTSGEVTFEFKELEVGSQYVAEDGRLVMNREFPSQTIEINKVKTTSNITANVENTEDEFGNADSSRRINVTLKIKQRTFAIDLTKVDADNTKIQLKGASFIFTQADGATTVAGTTDENGNLKLSADVMGKAGTYTYLLEETNAPVGYSTNKTVAKIKVTFDSNSTITKLQITDGASFVSTTKEDFQNAKIDMMVKNSKSGDTYNIKLIKKMNAIRVPGAKYNFQISAGSGEELNITDYTNEKGEIDISKIPGSQEIIIKLKEIEAAPGYFLDEEEKYVTVVRDPETGYISTVPNKISKDLKVAINQATKTIQITVEAIEKTHTNEIRIAAVDKFDNTIYLAGARIDVLEAGATSVMEATTDGNGYINLNNRKVPGEGTFAYCLNIRKSPNGYKEYMGEQIVVNITFDAQGRITSIEKQQPENEDYDVLFETKEEEESVKDTATVRVKLEPTETFNLTLEKQAAEDKTITLKDVTYQIGVLTNKVTSTTTTKVTNQNGQIETAILGGDQVEITLTETKTQDSYKLEDMPKKIVINRNPDTKQLTVDETLSANDVTVEIDGTNIKVITKNERKKANIEMYFVKEDELNEAIKLVGVTIKVKETTTGREYTLVTNEAGEVQLEGFEVEEAGIYEFVISEITTVDGYELPKLQPGDEAKIKVLYEKLDGKLEVSNVIQEGGESLIAGISYTEYTGPKHYVLHIKLVVENTIKDEYKFNVNILKQDKITKQKLQDAAFKMTINRNGKGITATGKTDKNGNLSFTIPLLPNQTIINIKEILAPLGYVLDDTNQTITLNKDVNTGEVTITSLTGIDQQNISVTNTGLAVTVDNIKTADKEETFDIEINKVDNEDETILLDGAKFDITVQNEEGTKNYNNITTNKKTYVKGITGYGTIQIGLTETKAPASYQLDSQTKQVTITREQGSENITLENREGDNFQAVVDNENKIIKLTIKNKALKFTTNGNKVNKNDGAAIAGIEFTIGIVNSETGKAENTKVITTKEDGTLSFDTAVLTPGTHMLELVEKTPYEYEEVGAVRIQVTIGANGSVENAVVVQGDHVQVTIENGVMNLQITNEPSSNYIWNFAITVVDRNNQEIKLPDAEFEIAIKGGNGYNESATITTGQNGTAGITGLGGYGEITVTINQNKASGGYQVDDEEKTIIFERDKANKELSNLQTEGNNYTVTIDEETKTVHVVITNKPLQFTTNGTKVNKNDGVGIAGIQFTVGIVNGETGKAENTKVITTKEDGTLSFDTAVLTPGTHILELVEKTPEEYEEVEAIRVEVTVGMQGSVENAVLLQGSGNTTVTVQNGKLILAITNEPSSNYTWNFEITKVDEANQEIKLKDVTFDVKVKDGNNDNKTATITTDENGKASITGLGGYGDMSLGFIETKAPVGYLKDAQEKTMTFHRDKKTKELSNLQTQGKNYTASIDQETKTIKVVMTNGPIKISTNVTKVNKNDGSGISGIEFIVGLVNAETGLVENTEAITTGADGNIKFATTVLDPGTYTLELVEKTPEEYEEIEAIRIEIVVDNNGSITSATVIQGTQNASVTVENEEVKLQITNEPSSNYTWNFEITKVDEENQENKLKNATFDVKIKDGDKYDKTATLTTDENGKASITGLGGYGDMSLGFIETKAPAGYQKDAQEKTMTFHRNKKTKELSNLQTQGNNYVASIDQETKTIKVIMTNKPLRITTNVTKVNSKDGTAIAGIEFMVGLVNSETGLVENTKLVTTGENGEIKIDTSVVEAGTYTFELKEKTPYEYEEIGSIRIEVTVNEEGSIQNARIIQGQENTTISVENGEIKLQVSNEPSSNYTWNFEITKIDEENQETKLRNATFNVIVNAEKGYRKTATISTDENGKAYVNGIEGYGDITLEFTETQAPGGYVFDQETKTITLKRNKKTKELSDLQSQGSNYTASIDQETKTVTVIMTNKPMKFTTNLMKINKNDGSGISGIEFTIGLVNPETGLVENTKVVTTGIDGNLSIDLSVLTAGTYTFELVEKTPYEYEQTDTIRIQVTIGQDGKVQNATIIQGQKNATIAVEKGQIYLQVVNEPSSNYTWNFEITKAEEGKQDIKLSNATFEVQVNDEKEYSKNWTITTGKDGKASIHGIEGYENITLRWKETKAPIGYALDTEQKTITFNRNKKTKELTNLQTQGSNYTASIDQETKTIQVVMTDKPMKIITNLTKVNKNDGTKMANIEFTIGLVNPETDTVDNTIVATTGADGSVNVITNLQKAGTYTYELVEKTPEGFEEIGTIRMKVVIGEDGIIQNAEMIQGNENVTISVEGGIIKLQVVNEPSSNYTWNFEITKVNEENKEIKLNGAQFDVAIKDSNNDTKRETITTGQDGKAVLTGLQGYGDILVGFQEIKAPDRYEEDTEVKVINFKRDKKTKELSDLRPQGNNYTVSIDQETKTIKVVMTNKPKKEFELIIEKVDKDDKEMKLKNVTFEINGEEFTTNELGIIETYQKVVDGVTVKEYTIKETQALDKYELIPEIKLEITFDAEGKVTSAVITQGSEYVTITKNQDGEVRLQISNQREDSFSIELEKQDNLSAETKLAGAEYQVVIENKAGIILKQAEVTTLENGIALINDIKGDGEITITITETKAPDGYKLDSTPKVIKLMREKESKRLTIVNTQGGNIKTEVDNLNKIIKVIVTDERKGFYLEITKVDKQDNTIKLKDVVFNISGIKLTTKENGTIKVFAMLPDGQTKVVYQIIEERAAEGYITCQEIWLEVIYDVYGNVTQAQIIKGVEDAKIDSVTTNEVKVTITNEKQTDYNMKIEKTDMDDSTVKLPGAVYKVEIVTTSGTTFTEEITTQEDGSITLPNLKGYGDITVTLTEIKAPAGYKLDSTPKVIHLTREETKQGTLTITNIEGQNIKAEVNPKTGMLEVQVQDQKKGFQLEIEKVDKQDETIKLPGAEFMINAQTKVTNENGIISIYETIVDGMTTKIYQISEIAAPDGYAMNGPIKLQVTFNEEGKVVNAEILEGAEYAKVESIQKGKITLVITNEKLVTYGLELEKVNILNEKEKLQGAIYHIKVEAEGRVIIEKDIETKEDGIALLERLQGYGEITITLIETKAPNGYKLDSTPKVFKLTRDKQTKEMTLINTQGNNYDVIIDNENKIIKVKVKDAAKGFILDITKVDKKDTNIKLSGVEFEIGGATLVTDKEGKVYAYITKVQEENKIVYTLTENKTLEGYILNEEVKIEVTYNENGEVIDAKIISGDNVTIQEISSTEIKLVITNQREENYQVEVVKQDKEGNKLQGAGYQVQIAMQDETTITKDIETKQDGKDIISKLRGYGKGTISLQETKAPDGYKRDTEEKHITFERDKQTGSIKVTKTEGKNVTVTVDDENKVITITVIDEKLEEGDYIVEIIKVSKVNKELRLPEAIFDLTMNSADGKINKVEEVKTSSNGMIQTEAINWNGELTILLTEIQAPNGYKIDNQEKRITVGKDKKVTIDEIIGKNVTATVDDTNKKIQIIIEDEPEELILTITKVDKENETIKLAGAEFKVGDLTLVTDKDGIASSYLGEPKVYQTYIYTITETIAPEGYEKIEPVKLQVTFDENGKITDAKLVDETSNVIIDKITENGISIIIKDEKKEEEKYAVEVIKQEEATKEKLQKAIFNAVVMVNEKEEVVKELITNQEGKAIIEKLTGSGVITIKLTETKAPTGYQLDSEEKVIKVERDSKTKELTLLETKGKNIKVVIDQENKVIQIIVLNQPMELDMIIEKVDKRDREIKIPGVHFKINDQSYETDSQGRIEEKFTLADGSKVYEYTIHEVKPANGYQAIGKMKLQVTVDQYGVIQKAEIIEGNTDAEVSIKDNKIFLIILNEKIEVVEVPHEVEIQKVDNKTLEILKGAEFTYTIEKNGEIIEEKVAVGKEGSILLQNLPMKGKFTIKLTETKAPNGYLLDKTQKTIVYEMLNGKIEIDEELTSKNIIIKVDNKVNPRKLIIQIKNEKEEEVEKHYQFHIEKFISKRNDQDIKDTIPEVKISDQKPIEYITSNKQVTVKYGDIIIYTIRVYNEGNATGYAALIKDKVPEGLEFIEDHEVNKKYGWKKSSEKGMIETQILAKENGEENQIEGFDFPQIATPAYKDIQVAFRVTVGKEPGKEITNIVILNKVTDEDGNNKTPEIPEEGKTTVKVDYFDLETIKYITQIIQINTKTGEQITTNFTKDEVGKIIKVDIPYKQYDDTMIKIVYKIEIKNTGNMAGKVTNIVDYIPSNVAYHENLNKGWKLQENNKAQYDFKDLILKPGESKEVSITLNWQASQNITGTIENIATGVGEEEIDQVMKKDSNNQGKADAVIGISTGQKTLIIILPTVILAIFAFGVYEIKKRVLK